MYTLKSLEYGSIPWIHIRLLTYILIFNYSKYWAVNGQVPKEWANIFHFNLTKVWYKTMRGVKFGLDRQLPHFFLDVWLLFCKMLNFSEWAIKRSGLTYDIYYNGSMVDRYIAHFMRVIILKVLTICGGRY